MDILNTKLIDLMPTTLRASQEIQWICASVQPEIDEIIACIDKILFTRLNYLDDLTLDYLLSECGIANSLEMIFIISRVDKINFIKSYVKLKKLKGTKAGIQYVLDLLGFKAEILEWFEHAGEPYTFQISIPGATSLNPQTLKLLDALVYQYKNTRSWFSYVQNIESESTTYVAIATTINITVRDK